jgi:hypothetical protein
VLVLAMASGLALLLGCGKEATPLPGAGASTGAPPPGAQAAQSSPADASTPPAMGSLPEGHPPISQAPAGGERPLKPTGIGSQAELDRVIAGLSDSALHARFEDGFRRCFTSDQSARDYMGAAAAMNEILAKQPAFAPAMRVLAYAKLNTGDMQGSTDLYRKAVEADPTYGEAHYALAFMLTQMDPVEGRKHFEKAMELGVPDERDLRTKFYPSTGM